MARKTDEPRINRDIRAKEVLLIDEQGAKKGVTPIEEAFELAEEKELDLVEVAPGANPPVCRVMDYGKYKYQQQKRDKDARKKTKTQQVKEMKMRPKIDQHDYDFKVRAVKSFLEAGHRVKVAIFFRGREMAFLDRGREVLDKVIRDCEELGKLEVQPRMEGRYMRMMLSPTAQKKIKTPKGEESTSDPVEKQETPTGG
ncbi:MAG: translation initiation factor IF-3 [Synergistota bacterium]|nr:translation initiation factor IF-3 [Synergistota bacterium]